MALDTGAFGHMLQQFGYHFYTGVPCSFLSPLINYAMNECRFIMNVNEGDAVAMACGAQLAGHKSVVLMQNSGLANAVSPLTSLNVPFRLPVLGFVSLRGEEGLQDEPQHELMGQITTEMLDLIRVQWEYLSSEREEVQEQLQRADACIANNQTFFFVVRKGVFDKCPLRKQSVPSVSNQIYVEKERDPEEPKRAEVLQTISSLKDNDTIVLATTGKSGRELYEIDDADNNFYMVGSMGCISPLGVGLSLNCKKKVIAIDGDGALLMRMGNIATNATYAPENFLHILIDNHMHDSTGGQATVSQNINFVAIAANAGYEQSVYIHSLKELETFIARWKEHPRPSFAAIKISAGTKENLGRPSIKPHEVKERLMHFVEEA